MNTPKIRFKGFTDDWEQRKLEDVMDTVTDYVAAGSFEDIRNNVTYLNEPGYAQLVRTVDLKKKFTNNDSVYVDESAFKYLWRVNLNDECIVLPNIGANIGEVYFVEPSGLPYDNNVLGPNAILLKANEDTYFAFTALNNLTFQKQLFENVGSSGQPKFNKTELKSIQLYMPQNEEQVKIGQYFRKLDHLITLHQRKCDETKQLKKIMLQKMFPKNGEKNPEIRFEGFTDDWEQRKLGDVLKERTERAKGKEELLSVTIANGVIRQADSEKRNIASEDKRNYKVVKKSDIPYNSMRMWQGAVGNSQYDGIVSPAYTILVPTDEANDKFFMELFKKENSLQRFKRWSQGLTSDTWNLKYPALSTMQFFIPSIKEQKRIANCLQELDHLITLHQRKCEKLKELKKYMLQNMFV